MELKPVSAADRVASIETVTTNSDTDVPSTLSPGSNSNSPVANVQPTSVTTGVPDTTFVDRVSEATQLATQTGRPLRVRLSPPELGSMLIEVAVRNGAMTARLEVQTSSAQQAVLEQISLLRSGVGHRETGSLFCPVRKAMFTPATATSR